MTLEEKVGQTVLDNASAGDLEIKVRSGKVSAVICDDLELNNKLQHIAVEESRLGIPLLIGADVIHGYRTTFPIPLAESCSWNLELLERASAAAAAEAAAAAAEAAAEVAEAAAEVAEAAAAGAAARTKFKFPARYFCPA